MVVSFVDNNNVMKPTVETEWNCRATSFPQYLASILSDASFPADCVAPGIDVFSKVNVVYIEETIYMDGRIMQYDLFVQKSLLKEK